MSNHAKESEDYTDPKEMIRSFLNTFTTGMASLDGAELISEIISTGDSIDSDGDGRLSNDLDGYLSGPSTPSLSLPESFDADIQTNKSIGIADLSKIIQLNKNQLLAGLGKVECSKCTKMAAENNTLRVKARELENSLADRKAVVDKVEADLHRIKRLSDINSDNFRVEVSTLEDRCNRLGQLMESETAARRLSEEKASKFVTVDDELRRKRVELEEVRQTLQQQTAAFNAIQESERHARALADDSVRAKELLQHDKLFLQKELRAAEVRGDEFCRRSESLQSKATSLETKVAQLTDQLLSAKLSAAGDFDHRVDKEIRRIREDSQREMEAIRATSKDILDRENRVLREAKTTLEQANEQLSRRNDSLCLQVAQLERENASLQADKHQSIAELRGELKMKSFELTALGATFEEKMTQLRQSEIEIDTLTQEVSLHKTALLRLETESAQRVATLEQDLERAMLKVRAYEALEQEIDGAIMRAAESSSSAGVDQVDIIEQSTQRLLQSVKGVPINPERRVKQAIHLAQKLLELEGVKAQLARQNEELLKRLETSVKEAETAKEDLSRAAQPTAYLVNKLRDEESAKAAFFNKCKQLEADLQRHQQFESRSTGEIQQLKQRLQAVLEQRGELDSVKSMLQALQNQIATQAATDDHSASQQDEQDHDWAEPYSVSHTQNPTPAQPRTGMTAEAAAKTFGLSPELIRAMTSPPAVDRRE